MPHLSVCYIVNKMLFPLCHRETLTRLNLFSKTDLIHCPPRSNSQVSECQQVKNSADHHDTDTLRHLKLEKCEDTVPESTEFSSPPKISKVDRRRVGILNARPIMFLQTRHLWDCKIVVAIHFSKQTSPDS